MPKITQDELNKILENYQGFAKNNSEFFRSNELVVSELLQSKGFDNDLSNLVVRTVNAKVEKVDFAKVKLSNATIYPGYLQMNNLFFAENSQNMATLLSQSDQYRVIENIKRQQLITKMITYLNSLVSF